MKTFKVSGSHGELKFDPKTGKTNNSDLLVTNSEYKNITKIDVIEYRKFYGYKRVSDMPTDIDILDVGYWQSNGDYEPPCADWREEAKRFREGIFPSEINEPYQPPVRIVEELFDINSDDNDQEVILVSDLTEHQKRFLGIIE
jgi:hypothetical protein